MTGAGLTLQGGTVTLNGSDGLVFSGTQTLAGNGTVNLSAGDNITLNHPSASNILTIAAGITIHGGGGAGGVGSTIDIGAASLDNKGILSGDLTNGSPLTINGTNWVNEGTIQAISGCAVTLSGSWTNKGTLAETSSTVNLGGTFTTSTSGVNAISGSGGIINFTGTLTNDTTLTLDGTNEIEYDLNGGTISGGIITTPNGGQLVATQAGGTLDGVTLDGILLVGQIINTFVNMKDGLTLGNSNAIVTMEGDGGASSFLAPSR